MAVTTRLIGKLGGGRESQEFTVTTTEQTRTVGEGRWLCGLNKSSSALGYMNGGTTNPRVFTGPTTITFRVNTGTGTGYIAPLT